MRMYEQVSEEIQDVKARRLAYAGVIILVVALIDGILKCRRVPADSKSIQNR
jgi:hypothetical protein